MEHLHDEHTKNISEAVSYTGSSLKIPSFILFPVTFNVYMTILRKYFKNHDEKKFTTIFLRVFVDTLNTF